AWHHTLSRARLVDFLVEELQVTIGKLRYTRIVAGDSVHGQRIGEDPRVGAARHRNAAEGLGDPEELLKRARHRAQAGAAGQYESAVDIEQEKCGRGAQSVGLFATNVARPRSFRGRLFLEVDALTFVQLIEASLHGAAMEEPLLATVVTNEPEPPVTNESLD